MNILAVDKIIKNALLEDGIYGDITTEAVIESSALCCAEVIAKEEGIIAGIDVFKRVFEILGEVEVNKCIKDGDKVRSGQIICRLKGNAVNSLKGERVALNLLQRMSGIATITNRYVEELKNSNTKILDTRKTTPNLRVLEKYAVKVGGGINHRYGLSDGILIKDNHISAAGGIKAAVHRVKCFSPYVRKIEIETETLEQVKEALDAGVDIIMLDNMDIDTMKKAVKMINNKALIEASGNMNIDKIKLSAEAGVDYISVGALTHSFKVLDISMKNLILK